VKEMPEDTRPVLQLVAFSNNTLNDLGEPDIIIDIDGYQERKEKIMEAHASQTGPLLKSLAADTQEGQDARDMWMKYETFYSYDRDEGVEAWKNSTLRHVKDALNISVPSTP